MRSSFKLRGDSLILREKDVTKQIKDWLWVRRWRCSRQQSALIEVGKNADGSARMMRLGERGRSDFVCWRPLRQWLDQPAPAHPHPFPRWGLAEMFFVEIKAPGKKPTLEQMRWLEERQVEGFLATWSDSLTGFADWYDGHFRDGI